MEYTFYAVSNSEPITEVMEWNGYNWMPKYSDCKVISLRPYVFETPDGCYTPIYIGHLKDSEGKIGNDFPREFWEYQPCILVDMDYLLSNVLDHV